MIFDIKPKKFFVLSKKMNIHQNSTSFLLLTFNKKKKKILVFFSLILLLHQGWIKNMQAVELSNTNATVDCDSFCPQFSNVDKVGGLTQGSTWTTLDDAMCASLGSPTTGVNGKNSYSLASLTPVINPASMPQCSTPFVITYDLATAVKINNGNQMPPPDQICAQLGKMADHCYYHNSQVESQCRAYNMASGLGQPNNSAYANAVKGEQAALAMDIIATGVCGLACTSGNPAAVLACGVIGSAASATELGVTISQQSSPIGAAIAQAQATAATVLAAGTLAGGVAAMKWGGSNLLEKTPQKELDDLNKEEFKESKKEINKEITQAKKNLSKAEEAAKAAADDAAAAAAAADADADTKKQTAADAAEKAKEAKEEVQKKIEAKKKLLQERINTPKGTPTPEILEEERTFSEKISSAAEKAKSKITMDKAISCTSAAIFAALTGLRTQSVHNMSQLRAQACQQINSLFSGTAGAQNPPTPPPINKSSQSTVAYYPSGNSAAQLTSGSTQVLQQQQAGSNQDPASLSGEIGTKSTAASALINECCNKEQSTSQCAQCLANANLGGGSPSDMNLLNAGVLPHLPNMPMDVAGLTSTALQNGAGAAIQGALPSSAGNIAAALRNVASIAESNPIPGFLFNSNLEKGIYKNEKNTTSSDANLFPNLQVGPITAFPLASNAGKNTISFTSSPENNDIWHRSGSKTLFEIVTSRIQKTSHRVEKLEPRIVNEES